MNDFVPKCPGHDKCAAIDGRSHMSCVNRFDVTDIAADRSKQPLPGLSAVGCSQYGIAGRNFGRTDELSEVINVG